MDETIRRYGFLVTTPGERWQYSNLEYGLPIAFSQRERYTRARAYGVPLSKRYR